MKLQSVRIREFRSIWDSTPFDVRHAICLVGKNEAGKTGVLQALYRLNPLVAGDGAFDVTDDYPRSSVEDYQQEVESGKRQPATVVEATFALDQEETDDIAHHYGPGALARPEVVVSKGYRRDETGKCTLFVEVPAVESQVVSHLIEEFSLPEPTKVRCNKAKTLAELLKVLNDTGAEQDKAASDARALADGLPDQAEKAAALEASKALGQSEPAKALKARLGELVKAQGGLGFHIWTTHLRSRLPKFLYFDEYYQMRGHENVQALKKRMTTDGLLPSDHPMLGLIELARLDLDKLLSPTRTQDLKNKLQGASNHLSSQVLKYWSQNKHLRMTFDVRPALPGDPDGMREGTNIWGEVFDSKHLVSTGLGTRSAGFVWFFSFLAWYSAVKKKDQPLVLLLDEPGLSLHGRAQADLLKYFETEIVTNPRHQLIYTTHSPFMVDPEKFDRVRIVQDKSIDSDVELPRDQDGTKVFSDILEAGPDSLFPLQGALGYDIYQTLFVGPNSLIVEGVSDLLYIQTISGLLQSKGRTGLDSRWTITPVGGSDKVPTFVALIGSQKNIKVATLIDFQKSDQQTIENLYKKRLLKKNHVLTYADFTGTTEADVEDMFDESLYLDLVNAEFTGSLSTSIRPADLTSRSPRIVVRLNVYFALHPLTGGVHFNHYRPARHFAEKVSTLTIPDTTLGRFESAFKALNALLKHSGA